MKPIYRPHADHSADHQSPVVSIHPLYEDEAHQERMRRLHNARAIRRAAQHHRRASAL